MKLKEETQFHPYVMSDCGIILSLFTMYVYVNTY